MTWSGCWFSNDSANDPYQAESSGRQKKISTYFYCVAPWSLFLLPTSGSGRLNSCRSWRSSVGWILCWDDADAGDYVADVSMELLVLTAGLYWCRVWNWHIFPQLSLITAAIWRSFSFTIYCLKQIYTADQTISTLWSDTSQYSATALNIILN